MATNMKNYLSPQQGIKELVVRLENQLGSLANEMKLHSSKMRVDVAWHIPYRDQAMVDDSKVIQVETLYSDEAANRVIEGLTAIRIEAGNQNPRETLRAPGLVALPKKWIQQLETTNSLKSEIQSLVEVIPDQYERMKLWKSMPYLSGLQVMRQAWIVPAPAKVRFYWDSAPSVKPKTVGALIEEYSEVLRKMHGHVPLPSEMDSDDRTLKYAFGISELKSLNPNERIAVFRAGKPHIRARVTFLDKIKPIMRPCSTPIIYDRDDPVPLVTPLVNWEPTQRGTQRSSRAKIELEPFVENLYLHRYLEKYR
tara:strand:- start:15054 stop:15983 length:930 start_codon:yes stop_codon:yes gene_type:complete